MFNLVVVDYIDGFSVSINSIDLGIVKSKSDVQSRLSVIEKQIEYEKNIDIEFEDHLILYSPIETTLDRFTVQQTLDQNLKNHISYKCKVWALVVNNKESVFCRTKEEIEELVNRIEKKFVPKAGRGEVIENLTMRIMEPYTIEQAYSYYDAIKTLDEAVDYALQGTQEIETYAVQQGDNFFTIAKKFDINFTQLVRANEEFDPEKLKAGDKISLSLKKPVLNVESKYRFIKEVTIPPPVRVVLDSELLRTERKVDIQGESGRKQIFADKTYINEKQFEVVIVKEIPIKAPKLRQLRIGTRRTPNDILVSGAVLPPGMGVISDYFGAPRGGGRRHLGIDIAIPTGASVLAYRPGTILRAGWDGTGYGNLVTIAHDDGTETRYAHNSKILVEVGQRVAKGDIIALSGNTGKSTGPHIHFEIRVGGKPVDPLLYLRSH